MREVEQDLLLSLVEVVVVNRGLSRCKCRSECSEFLLQINAQMLLCLVTSAAVLEESRVPYALPRADAPALRCGVGIEATIRAKTEVVAIRGVLQIVNEIISNESPGRFRCDRV